MNPAKSGSGIEMYELARDLFPICRSITGEGVRKTLRMISDVVPELTVRSVASGTRVNDWVVPNEWNVTDAYVADMTGRRVIDFRSSNLHLVNYSAPVHGTFSRDELLGHIHTIPDHPDVIPYRTSYYNRSWGFCLEHRRLAELTDEQYEVLVDTTLEPGELNYGEVVLPGAANREILFSTHICHPSLANDNLSGISLVVSLVDRIRALRNRRYTYRFVFVPGTIGAITWLARNPNGVSLVEAAIVVALVGAKGRLHYKQTPDGSARVDRVVRRVLRASGLEHEVRPFSPYGYDERQYASPGYAIPAGSLTRTPHGEFPEYHTSADNMEFIDPETLEESLDVYLDVVRAFESERIFVNQYPFGEPQLGRRGLYDKLGGGQAVAERRMALLWLLNRSTGNHSLNDIAEQSGIELRILSDIAATLVESGLLTEL